MSKEIRAERIKNVILENSTYEELAEKTGISVSTLVRIASGKTEPKFSDIIKIAM
ncbi:helix-turn-helix transcriptional regulator, partial [Salmonella enterica subsp. enterica serovar Enteritidis]|nr:helix-turn-helix transcriptional regulator [Salmonella enterica subsp. enterica serovar Enteritidis]